MAIRAIISACAVGGLVLIGGCGEPRSGPIMVSAIGEPPELVNPNLQPLDAPSAALLQATAQGLVRFDAAGQIEPALAQSWIVSDDGLRYTFRLARTQWTGDGKVTAEQVVERLNAAMSSASRNPAKPLLGVVDEIVAMTDDVLEISLVAPRPNFLQLLAQPQLALLRNGSGTGPYHAVAGEDEILSLHIPDEEEEEEQAETGTSIEEEAEREAVIRLRGERAALAVARFDEGKTDLVIGGTAGDLPIARAAEPGDALIFDPVAGLFGLSFASNDGLLGEAEFRQALSMAIDRAALVAALGVPDLQPRESLVPLGVDGLSDPALPGWASAPLPMRRFRATQTVASLADGDTPTVRVAMPDGPGYRIVFAHLRRDWRAIGVEAERVSANDRSADLRLIDAVAPIDLASWYLRIFSCAGSAVCDASADEMMAAARIAPSVRNRQALLANADRILADVTPFIPLTAPIRWSLVAPRLTGFRPNVFGRHNIGELIAETP